MSSLTTPLCLNPGVSGLLLSPSFASFPTPDPLPLFSSGIWSIGAKDKRFFCSRCSATSKQGPQVVKAVLEQSTTLSKWQDITNQDSEEREVLKVQELNKLTEWIETIKSMLASMGDGEISISAYDTAWVALVEDIHGNGDPQFPSSIQWIINNQLADGSWGDESIFTAHDRILNTLGCVVALKKWNLHPERRERGLSFLNENMNKLGDENAEHMTIGFEVAFPSLVEIARKLDLEIPDDSPAVQNVYAQRKLKLTKIPMDMVHIVPTTLLHSLEGMEGLDWEKLIKLQSVGGSFLFSPASTAFALMNTKDEKCLQYLKKPVEKFNGGVPNVYPVDLFEHIWSVDRLERLGVSRYFKAEIEECVNYLSRYWTEDGIAWARNSSVRDIDDTAMGFRLLRLHGHDVSPDVFRHFEKGGEFFCFAGQSNQAVTGLFNLYRAAQVLFPGETILQEAKKFAYKFLREKQASNQLLDKWIITKDLPGEVGYALDIPWYASLPRIEARFYLEQYGGKDDVWIGKTLYRNLNRSSSNTANRLVHILHRTLDNISVDALKTNGNDVHKALQKSFETWLLTWEEENDKPHQVIAEVLVSIIISCGGHSQSEELLSHPQYKHLVHLTNRVCYQFGGICKKKVETNGASTNGPATLSIDSDMQELVQTVLQNSDGISSKIKQTFLTVAKSCFYTVYCPQETMDHHISEVLFKRVV